MSYVPPTVPERWDIGLWDQAHWDGQLGLQVAAGSFLFNGQPVTLLLSRVLVANTGSFVFTTPDAGIAKGLSAVLDDGSFVFNGPDVELVYQINHLVPETGTFVFSYPDIGLYQGGVLHAETVTFAFDEAPIEFWSSVTMVAETGAFNFRGGWLDRQIYQQPGFYNLGMKVYVPRKR
jgi:hypothetical protein